MIVHGQAFGVAQEQSLLVPMVEGAREAFDSIGYAGDIFHQARLVADAGFYNAANVRYLFEEGIDGYVPDTHFRQRDPRFAGAEQHKPAGEPKAKKKTRKFRPEDFVYDPERQTCTCPAGKRMYLKNRHFTVNGYQAISFQGKLTDCRVCALREQCLQRKDQISSRQVYFFEGRSKEAQESFTDQMKRKIDT